MPLNQELVTKLEPIREALFNCPQAFMPVVGSGLSRPRLKSWVELLELLAAELPPDMQKEVVKEMAAQRFLDVASVIERHVPGGRSRVESIIQQLYQRPKGPRPAVYDALVQLPMDHFATTNYDPWLKCALSDARPSNAPRVYAPTLQGSFPDTLANTAPLVLMVHGDADEPTTCVLSVRGYRNLLYGAQSWREGMKQLVGQRKLLFFGHSLADPDLTALLDEWQAVFLPNGGPARHYLFDANISIVRRELLMDRGVEPIDYGDHALLPEILEYLGRPPAGQGVTVASDAEVDVRKYLVHLIDDTRSIDIQGIGTRHGQGKTALSYSIEELYTPLRTRAGHERAVELEPDNLTGRRDELVNLSDVLPKYRLLLIEGQPGAGKTTFLRLVACMLARDALGIPGPEGQTWSQRVLGLEAVTPALTPIFLRASLLVPLLKALPSSHVCDRGLLATFIEQLCCANHGAVPCHHWEKLLEVGQAQLLLDGVDEVTDPELRNRLFESLRDAAGHWPGPVIVSSRPIETERLSDIGFFCVTVEPFRRQEIETFVGRWVKGLRATEDLALGSDRAERHRAELVTAILQSPQIRRLAENPVMLTCLCVVHFNEGKLPDGRARLYSAVLEWLLKARTERRKAAGHGDEFARRAFARLALGMMTTAQGKRSSIGFGEATRLLCADLKRQFPDDAEDQIGRTGELWLQFECEASGIIQELPGRQLRFWHLTFQEYLAALQLSWQSSSSDGWWTDIVSKHLQDAQWRETIEVLPGCLFDGPGINSVDDLLNRVVGLLGTSDELSRQACLAAVLSRLLLPLNVYEYKVPPKIKAVYDTALERSMAIFTLEGAQQVPVKTRIEVAEALGRAGDPRLTPDKDNFIRVPGTSVSLGKYPVTVEEYRHFVDARGYEQSKYWSPEGWAAKTEGQWGAPDEWDEQLQTPNRPVTRVCWYEAEAYCAWKSDHTGQEIRLPTEQEWQAAATAKQGEYPWGEPEPNEELANFAPGFKPNVGHPTPVGIYPAGNGRYGHCDLAGNVWEWCEDLYDGNEPGRERVIRGGSWINSARSCRSAYRDWGHSSFRIFYLGFRLAAGQ